MSESDSDISIFTPPEGERVINNSVQAIHEKVKTSVALTTPFHYRRNTADDKI